MGREQATIFLVAHRHTIERRTLQLIGDAKFDLIYGHNGTSENYPGFDRAIEQLKDDLDGVVDEYTDEDGYVVDTEFDEAAHFISRAEQLKVLVGKELAIYL